MKRFRYLLILGIILTDQILKLIIRFTMYVGETIPVVEEIFHITYVQNPGAAFGILNGATVFLVVIPVIAVGVGIWYMEKYKGEHWTLILSLSLIISGGMGNLLDRIFLGYVTDMFDFRIWPVFNIADIAVCVGAFFLVIYIIKFYDDGKEEKHNKDNL